MKLTIFAPIAALAAGTALATVAVPATAQAQDETAAPTLEQVLAMSHRDDDRARDQYRRPAETLEFFQVEPTMTVAEFGPGGAWYTRVLAPWIMPQGTYIAFNGDSDAREYRSRAQEARSKAWTENFISGMEQGSGMEIDPDTVFEIDEMPESVAGTVDRVLIFRSMHGLANGNSADDVLDAVRTMLKDDGMVGVVQHRKPADASDYNYGAALGYMKTAQVIAIFAANGFELVDSSEINANPNDPADWARGVWTLPPVLATGEDDPRRAEYLEIGESDRMTLLFRKAG